MEENIVAQRYKELVAAIRDQEEAERNLEACKRRVAELSGLAAPLQMRKPAKKTLTAKEMRAACNI